MLAGSLTPSVRRVGGRLAQTVLVVCAVATLTFVLFHLVPGDPARDVLGPRATPESVAALRAELGMNRSLPAQFVSYLGNLARGDLGTSIAQPGRAVIDIIGASFPVTLAVVATAILFSLAIGIPFGLLAALSAFRAVDVAVRGVSLVLLATPTFFLGLVLLLVVALRWGLAPAGGWGAGWPDNVRYLWLPSLCLAGYLAPIIARAVRQSARETAQQRFVEAAVARGLSSRTIALRHILPNSLLPVITIVGFNVATLLGGTAVIEAVFSLPGIGTDLVTAVGSRDYPVVQAIALLTAVLVVIVNALTDLLATLADPRIRDAAR